MGRIGRSYPRFEETPQSAGSALVIKGDGISAYEVAGAIAGILSALGLIGWLLTR